MSIGIKLFATAALLALLAGCASPPPAPLAGDPNRAGGAAGYSHRVN